ncbi:MAG: cupin-like domain-containing protein [Bdellovibrionales bacterium]|nr:cupin-like domain-containing protein [Bdellovibrionales bacterium]
MQDGLTALIHPYTIKDFLDSYENNEPMLVHHSSKELGVLRDLPFLASLEILLKSWPLPIQAHLPDVRDEASSIDTTAKDAQKLFDNGMGLLFNDAHLISPLLAQWLEKIKSELGVSAMTYGRCLIYATPDGKGTAPHFDQNINFVLQIHGTKKWVMAPNQDVINPMTRHTMGQETDPELMSYLEAPLPTEMPVAAKTFELKPGSLLFVPRGYWHATEAEGDALSLNFTFTAPTWIDLLTAALRGRLAQSPEWRATAHAQALEKFDFLLNELVDDLPHWKAADILNVTE